MRIDDEKRDVAGRVTAYRLPHCTVYRGRSGLTFTDHLDPEPDGELDPRPLSEHERAYLEHQLGANGARVEQQLARLEAELGTLRGARLLDVGPGPGELMVRAAARGAQVEGLEPHGRHLRFGRERGLTIHHATAEQHRRDPAQLGRYDAITLWDVLEHVNYPDATLAACGEMLRPGGVLLLDTPWRDGAFHRAGDLAYRLSGGRATRLLSLLYAGHDYGHKQVLSKHEVRAVLERAGLSVSRLETIHELALPHESYLRRITRSKTAARALVPLVRSGMAVLSPHNKVFAVARRPA